MKNLRYSILLFCILFVFNNALGQKEGTLESRIKQIDSLLEIANKDLIGNGDRLKHIISLSQEARYPKGELKGLINLGVYYTNNAMIDSASYAYDSGEKIIKKHPELKFALPYIYTNKAHILVNQELHYRALRYFHKSHKINLELGDKKMAMITKMDILNCHLALGEPDKVIAYSTELLADPYVKNQDDLKYQIYSNMGQAYNSKKQYEKAINWWSANLESLKNSNKIQETGYLMTNIAEAHRSIGNYEKALEYAVKAKKTFGNKPEFSNYDAVNSLVLGKIYTSLDNPKKAIVHFENTIIKNPKNPLDLAFAYKNLGATNKRINSWDTSAKYYQKYGTLLDSLYRNKNIDMSKMSEDKIQLLEEEHKNELLTKNNDILNYKNGKQRLYIITLLVGFFSLLFILLSFVLYMKYNQREREIESIRENEKKILENRLQIKEEEFMATMISVNERLERLTHIKRNLSAAIRYNNREELIATEKRLDSFISSNADLSLINDRIESQYPKITAQINTHFPELSNNDVRHCLLMKLNLSIKESAQLLSVSTHAVKMARKRLRKKIDIPEDVSLKDHLQSAIS